MRHRRARAKAAEVDLTPMLDVVFILLIFFIVTAVFLQESAISLEAPPPDAPRTALTPTIIVEIDESGLVRVNGRAAYVESVQANIERLKAQSPESAVIIQAHPDARNQQVLRVRDQIASAKVRRVNLVLSDV